MPDGNDLLVADKSCENLDLAVTGVAGGHRFLRGDTVRDDEDAHLPSSTMALRGTSSRFTPVVHDADTGEHTGLDAPRIVIDLDGYLECAGPLRRRQG